MCTYVIVGKTEFPFWMRDTLVLSKPVHNGDNAIFQNPIPSFYFTWHIALYSKVCGDEKFPAYLIVILQWIWKEALYFHFFNLLVL